MGGKPGPGFHIENIAKQARSLDDAINKENERMVKEKTKKSESKPSGEVTYLISINYCEAGPYTLEELEALAREKKFSWGHYVLEGNTWYRAGDIEKFFDILNKNYIYSAGGDIGPAGGLVFHIDTLNERRFYEAALYKTGLVSFGEAQSLCGEYGKNNPDKRFEAWRMPETEELRQFSAAQYYSNQGSGYPPPVLCWSITKDGRPLAVCTEEKFDTWSPWEGRPVSRDGPHTGNRIEKDPSTPLHVRPVRFLKTVPLSNGKPVIHGWGAPSYPV